MSGRLVMRLAVLGLPGAVKCLRLARFFSAVQFTFFRSSAARSDDPAAILNEAASAYNAASRELEGIKAREQYDDLADSVTRAPSFTDLHVPNNDAFLSLRELPPGTFAQNG